MSVTPVIEQNGSSSVTSSVNVDQQIATRSSYSEEWCRLFETKLNIDEIRHKCLSGYLQSSRFRSVCWRVLLGCLPMEKSDWSVSLRHIRDSYTDLKNKVCLNPRLNDHETDPSFNNPLSQNNDNPWQQYFADVELKSCIHQDVERTFPEVEYFQSESTRKLMEDILFVYAKQNPSISYKQGMHEILGPLIFVIFYDHQAYVHTSERGGLSSLPSASQQLLSTLMDESFIEHDAFNIFFQIMCIIEPWYCVPAESGRRRSSSECADELFLRPQDRTTSQVVTKLNWIGDTLLRQADAQLYQHLENMEIAPQIYGIRWLRLLFGREFPIQDLLLLWDAIFADGAPFVLVDFLFITMLIYIRDLLLHSDYTGCLHYLMRYPPIVDVHCFLALALHIRNPQFFPKPNAYSFMNFTHITVTGRPHPNLGRDRSHALITTEDKGTLPERIIEQSLEKTGKMLNSLNKMGTQIANSLKEPVSPVASGSRTVFYTKPQKGRLSPNVRNNNIPKASSKRPKAPALPFGKHMGSPINSQKSRNLVSEEELELLKEQVSCLQVRLSEVDALNQFSAERLTRCADSMEQYLRTIGSPVECAAFKSVIEIRQVSRLLKGSLKSYNEQQETMKTYENSSSPVEVGSDPLGATTPDKNRSSRGSSVSSPVPVINSSLHRENELKDLKKREI